MIVMVVRVRFVVGMPYLLIFLPDELLRLVVRHSGDGRDGKVCATLSGEFAAEFVEKFNIS